MTGFPRSKPSGAASDRFLFDPEDPAPTLGGANFHFFPDLIGVRDQRTIEERRDVLVYTSAPLTSPVDVVGPVQAVVHAASEGRSTDITAKLVVCSGDPEDHQPVVMGELLHVVHLCGVHLTVIRRRTLAQ